MTPTKGPQRSAIACRTLPAPVRKSKLIQPFPKHSKNYTLRRNITEVRTEVRSKISFKIRSSPSAAKSSVNILPTESARRNRTLCQKGTEPDFFFGPVDFFCADRPYFLLGIFTRSRDFALHVLLNEVEILWSRIRFFL